MNLDDRIINFYRAGIGLATSAICLAFLALIGFLLINSGCGNHYFFSASGCLVWKA
jgi:hypothetical protein